MKLNKYNLKGKKISYLEWIIKENFNKTLKIQNIK